MIELKEDSWYEYRSDWLDPSRASKLFESLQSEEPWEQRAIVACGKSVLQPRLMSWAGDIPYKYSGLTLENRPMSSSLKDLCLRLNHEYGSEFNHVVLNLYRNGQDSVAYHADNEPELGPNPLIASISLGEPRMFHLRPKNKRFRRDAFRIRLEHGSLLMMGGKMQHRWRHALPKTSPRVGPRINITFRQLLGPPGWRSWLSESATHSPSKEKCQ